MIIYLNIVSNLDSMYNSVSNNLRNIKHVSEVEFLKLHALNAHFNTHILILIFKKIPFLLVMI